MNTSVFRINRLRFFRPLASSASIALFVLSFLTFFPIADTSERASAEVNGDNYELTIGMESDLNLAISPSREGKLSIIKNTITGSTNAPAGYKLYIASANENTSMLLDGEAYNSDDYQSRMLAVSGTFDTPEALFSTETTPATWGYAVPSLNNFDATYDVDNPSSTAKFAGMPASGSGQLIHSAPAAISNDTVEVYYGTKVNQNLRQGKYKTWINYIAVTDFSTIVNNSLAVSPSRIRNNYKPGTKIALTANFNAADDLGTFLPTVNNTTCGNPQKISNEPLVVTCELPENLVNGEYEVILNVPQLGKAFVAADPITIVDAYDAMQSIDEDVYDSVEVHGEYQFYDVRDNKKYFVTKLKNGDLYMTQNLAFELSTEGTVLDPATSDVNAQKTIVATDFATLQQGQTVTRPDLFMYYTMGDVAIDYNSSQVIPLEGVDEDSVLRHSAFGVGYSFNAAMTEAYSDSMQLNESICPKGWHIPNMRYNSEDSILNLYGSNLSSHPSIVEGGGVPPLYLAGQFMGRDVAMYNSFGTAFVGNEHEYYDQIQIEDLIGEIPLVMVRCVYPAPHKFSVTYEANNGANAPAKEYQGAWDTVLSTRFKLSEEIPVREGYTFKGWASSNTATEAEYQPGDFFTATGKHTLYAVWDNPEERNYFDEAFLAAGKTKTNGYYAMQDMNESICAAVPLVTDNNLTTQLIDLRDNNVYFVSKLADNQCWMTQNLNFAIEGSGTVLDPNSSSVAAVTTMKATDFATSDYYINHNNVAYRNGFETIDDIMTVASSSSDPLWHFLAGSSYTYSAATVKNATSNITTTYSNLSIVEGNGYGDVVNDVNDTEYVEIGRKNSRTSNVNEYGHMNGWYPTNATERDILGTDRGDRNQAHVVTINGASRLVVDIYYNTEVVHDYVIVWSGAHPTYNAIDQRNQDIIRVLSGPTSQISGTHQVGDELIVGGKQTLVVDGDTVTFGFTSDDDEYKGGYYGYYAIVTGYAQKEEPHRIQESICPKGWRLPIANNRKNEIRSLLEENSLDDYLKAPLNFTATIADSYYTTESGVYSLSNILQNSFESVERDGYIRCVAEDLYVKALSFDANGGENAPEGFRELLNIDSIFKSNITVPIQTPTREGYIFKGWAYASDASEPEVFPRGTVSFSGENTLYAVWQEE